MAEVKDLEQLPETAPEQAQEAPQTPAVPLKERPVRYQSSFGLLRRGGG